MEQDTSASFNPDSNQCFFTLESRDVLFFHDMLLHFYIRYAFRQLNLLLIEDHRCSIMLFL